MIRNSLWRTYFSTGRTDGLKKSIYFKIDHTSTGLQIYLSLTYNALLSCLPRGFKKSSFNLINNLDNCQSHWPHLTPTTLFYFFIRSGTLTAKVVSLASLIAQLLLLYTLHFTKQQLHNAAPRCDFEITTQHSTLNKGLFSLLCGRCSQHLLGG